MRFTCQNCGNEFDKDILNKEQRKRVKCPECGSSIVRFSGSGSWTFNETSGGEIKPLEWGEVLHGIYVATPTGGIEEDELEKKLNMRGGYVGRAIKFLHNFGFIKKANGKRNKWVVEDKGFDTARDSIKIETGKISQELLILVGTLGFLLTAGSFFNLVRGSSLHPLIKFGLGILGFVATLVWLFYILKIFAVLVPSFRNLWRRRKIDVYIGILIAITICLIGWNLLSKLALNLTECLFHKA